MQKTLKILKKAYNHFYNSCETEEELKKLSKEDLVDFIIWNNDRGFFNDYLKK